MEQDQHMPTQQVTVVHLFRYARRRDRWWAFQLMGIGGWHLRRIPGLLFSKLVGSGAQNGFSIYPNWSIYGLVTVWRDEAAALAFTTDPAALYTACAERAETTLSVWLENVHARGAWSGFSTFAAGQPLMADEPVAVLTRATLRLRFVPRFWSRVPDVSASLRRHPGNLLSIGIGEWPLIMQATFSIWNSLTAMEAYAYHEEHGRVVQRVREEGWFKEELFAHFRVLRIDGDLTDWKTG